MPAVDVVDEKDSIRVKVYLPGLTKEGIEVYVGNGMLTLKGAEKEKKKPRRRTTSGRNAIMGLSPVLYTPGWHRCP